MIPDVKAKKALIVQLIKGEEDEEEKKAKSEAWKLRKSGPFESAKPEAR